MDHLAVTITPAMIRAGEWVLENFRESYLDDHMVREIYIAMEAARCSTKAHPPDPWDAHRNGVR